MPPRFSPRDLAAPPEAFWNDEVEGAWSEPRSSEEAEQLLVAHDLSQVSRNVVAVLREVNGEYPAMFEDVLRWALALDRPDIAYIPNTTEDLRPPDRLAPVAISSIAEGADPREFETAEHLDLTISQAGSNSVGGRTECVDVTADLAALIEKGPRTSQPRLVAP